MTFTRESPVLVAGASGFVGSHTARLLTQQGRKVRVLLRKSSNQEALRDLPVEIFYGDVLETASLHAAMEGCASVFYSVVDARFWLSDTTQLYRNNVDGLVNAMEAALACGVERFIFTSTMGTLGINPNGPVTEDIPFNWLDTAPPYIRARLEAENTFLRYCRERGLPGVALCIANTYGPQDFQPTPHGGMVAKVAEGKFRYSLDAGAPTVDIRDAAQAAVLAERHGRIGERYIIANEFVSNRDFYNAVAAAGGHAPIRVIPLWAGYCLIWPIEQLLRLLRKKDYLARTDAVYLSKIFKAMDNTKARRELGWNPRPLSETIADAVAWFKSRKADQDNRSN